MNTGCWIYFLHTSTSGASAWLAWKLNQKILTSKYPTLNSDGTTQPWLAGHWGLGRALQSSRSHPGWSHGPCQSCSQSQEELGRGKTGGIKTKSHPISDPLRAVLCQCKPTDGSTRGKAVEVGRKCEKDLRIWTTHPVSHPQLARETQGEPGCYRSGRESPLPP